MKLHAKLPPDEDLGSYHLRLLENLPCDPWTPLLRGQLTVRYDDQVRAVDAVSELGLLAEEGP